MLIEALFTLAVLGCIGLAARVIQLEQLLKKAREIISELEHPVSHPIIQQPRTSPACQFCGNKLTKVGRSREGFWCCASCAILELNQLPNQDHVNELLKKVN